MIIPDRATSVNPFSQTFSKTVICKSKFLLGVEINLTNRTMEINLTNKTLYNKRGATYPNGTS